MTREEILRFVSGSSKYRDIYEKVLAKDSILSMQVMNEILNEEPQDPSDLCTILDYVRNKYRSILGGGPSDDETETRKAKIGIILLAAVTDGGMNANEQNAVNQIINSYEFRVPNPDYKAIFEQYKGDRSIEVLINANYGERVRLVNSVDYVFKVDGPLNEKERELMLVLLYRLQIQPKDTDLDLAEYDLLPDDDSIQSEEDDYAAPLEKRTATINSVTADHNVIVNGQKGVTLHINLDIVHCKGVDCKCGAWLYYANGNPVKDTNNKYYSSDGQVSASVPFKPPYDDTHYGDLQLFFPYDEFHIEGKNVSCYLSLQIYCSDTGEFISNFYKNNMTYSSGR